MTLWKITRKVGADTIPFYIRADSVREAISVANELQLAVREKRTTNLQKKAEQWAEASVNQYGQKVEWV